MAVDIVAQAEAILAGTFLARATYGGEYIDPAFNIAGDGDAELMDDYAGYLESQGWQALTAADIPTYDSHGGKGIFTPGGLYSGLVNFGADNTFDAQGLLAVKGDTLVLSFRGTDGEDPAVEDSQTFLAPSLAAHYKGFKSLVDAAYDYLETHPEISNIVVSGHSLGGAMVDVFTLVDAARFRALRPEGLTIVSLGSSGLPPELPEFIDGIDPAVATIREKVIFDEFGITITIDVLSSLSPPADYISLANSEDRAHFPDRFPDVPEDLGLVPIVTLKDNFQFGADTVFHNPNIDNSDVEYADPVTNPADFRGLGAEHNSALIWSNLQGLTADALLSSYEGHRLIFGITDYNAVPDYNGTPISLFLGYLDKDTPGNDNDSGTKALAGTTGADFILGLTGDDELNGARGNDLLSGGQGADNLNGGSGIDRLAGGTGRDVLKGGLQQDRFIFTALDHSTVGALRDVIADFKASEGDKINVSAIDAAASLARNQMFSFNDTGVFTGEAQIIALQRGEDTLLRFNVEGTGGSEMDILLKGVLASSLSAADFIL